MLRGGRGVVARRLSPCGKREREVPGRREGLKTWALSLFAMMSALWIGERSRAREAGPEKVKDVPCPWQLLIKWQ